MAKIEREKLIDENTRRFAVTGVHHGAIIYAGSKAEAENTFSLYFAEEEIVNIRDCENEPFEIKED